jgi:hypothetical protein
MHNRVLVLYNLCSWPFCFMFIQLVSFLDKPQARAVGPLSDLACAINHYEKLFLSKTIVRLFFRIPEQILNGFSPLYYAPLAGLDGIYDSPSRWSRSKLESHKHTFCTSSTCNSMLDCMHSKQWLFFPRDWTMALYMLPELGPSAWDLLSAGFVRPRRRKTDLPTCS